MLEGAEAAGHALGQLQQPVDGFDQTVGNAGLQEGHHAIPMRPDRRGQTDETSKLGTASKLGTEQLS